MREVKMPSMTPALNQHTLTLALKFSIVTIAVIALYSQDLMMIFQGALTDESTFHILAIPFLFSYFLFRKRKMIIASVQPSENNKRGFQKYFSVLAGISLFSVVVLLYWYGSYSFTPLEYHMATLPFMAAGLILILFGTQTLKQLAFPLAFLIFLTPPPTEILYSVGSFLANISAVVSNSLANVFGLHAALSASNVGPVITIVRPDGTSLPFNVSVACSGIYSIIGFLIFAVFIAYITPGKLLNKIVILILGIPLIMGLNIIRITTMLGIAFNWGEDLALNVFHTFGATVLMFIGTLVLLAVTEKLFKKPAAPAPCPTCNPASKNPLTPFCTNCGKIFKFAKIKLTKGDITKIVSVLAVTVILLSIQAPVFALTQGPAQVLSQTPSGLQVATSNSTLPAIPGYTLQYSYRDTAFEKESGNDAALVYCYSPTDGFGSSIWVALQIGASQTSQHHWETCLINFPISIGEQVIVKQLDLRSIQLNDNPPMPARYFAFQYLDTNQIQVVLYWYETAIFETNSTAQTKSVMMSLIMYPTSTNDVQSCETQELPIAQAIDNYWQPIKTWTSITLALSQNGLALSSAASAIFFLIVAYQLFLSRQEKLALLTMYQKLPAQDQLLIKAVDNREVQNSTHAITSEYQKLSSAPAPEPLVLEKLEAAEKAGLIKKMLTGKNDKPYFVWKNAVHFTGTR
jgi:exosortase